MKKDSWLPTALITLSILLMAGHVGALETIYMVRHADKAITWPKTRELSAFHPLSCEGSTRAERLAQQLGGADIAAIYTSTTTRTLATGMPLAEAAGVPISADDRTIKPSQLASFFAEMKERHAADSTILIVGHSNTLPELLIELGAKSDCYSALDIGDHDGELLIHGYEGLWRIDLGRPGCAGMERQVVKLDDSAAEPQAAPE